ncbi:MAG: hypothetical protein ACI9GW_001983 [Halieaceae bacterium]|jgi:hypothetical protein
MSYHWQKNVERDSTDTLPFVYKGLIFTRYAGRLTSEQHKSRKAFYAFYGNQAMTKQQIRYHVGLMIERRVYKFEAA